MATEILREYADSRGLAPVVDRDNGVLKGVRILGLVSKNKREYTQECVTKGMKLYEGLPSFIDHAKPGDRTPRSYRDKIGVHTNVRAAPVDNPGLISDFRINMKHPLAESVLWDAENAPGTLGFSHDAEGIVSKKNGKTIVEELVSVNSCDLVCKPATARGLFESEELPEEPAQREFAEHALSAVSDARTIVLSDQTIEAKKSRLVEVLNTWHSELTGKPVPTKESLSMEYAELTVESLTEHRKDLVEVLQGKDEKSKLVEEVTALKATLTAKENELTAAQATLAEAEAAKQLAAQTLAIAEELKAAKLDPEKVPAPLMEAIKTAKDAEARKPLIESIATLSAPKGGTTPPFAGTTPKTETNKPRSRTEILARLHG